MNCLICYSETESKLCTKCSKTFIYDNTIKMIRMKKLNMLVSNNKEFMAEYRLYNLLCKIFGKKNIYRHAHPLWAKSKKNVLLEYDVAIPSEKLLIEYDGKQHFIFPNYFHKTKKEFIEQKKRDRFKNTLAKKNDWKLIRFNYKDKIDNINIKRKLNNEYSLC